MDCCTMSLKSTLILASILMLLVISKCDNSKDKEECAESLVGLATCLPYVGGSAKSPTPDCCSGLKQVLKANKKCLCVVIKDRNDPDLGLNINLTLALTLPNVCHAPANISQCPVLLNLPPNSPDAQIFYQIGQNSSHASSPIAGGPNANAAIPTGSPTGAATLGSASPPQSGGCGPHNCNRWLMMEFVLIGLVLIQFLIV